MDAGQLVSDELIINLVKERLKTARFVTMVVFLMDSHAQSLKPKHWQMLVLPLTM